MLHLWGEATMEMIAGLREDELILTTRRSGKPMQNAEQKRIRIISLREKVKERKETPSQKLRPKLRRQQRE